MSKKAIRENYIKTSVETGRNYTISKERISKYTWHDWFAWHPVRISGKIVWFKTVKRKYICKLRISENHWVYEKHDNN